MALAVAVAGLLGLGALLEGTAYAVLHRGDLGTARNLATAAAWLRFAGVVVAVGAVCSVAWHLALRRRWAELAEGAGASVATFLVALGLLVSALDAPRGSAAGNVVAAVGIGGWALLATTRAARRSFAELLAPAGPRQAPLWLAVAGGLVLLAVGVGLPPPTFRQAALAAAAGAVVAVGVAAVAGALLVARAQGMIVARGFPTLAGALWTLVAASVARAAAAGAVLGPGASLTGIRVGFAVAAYLAMAGWLLLALAALGQLYALAVPGGGARTTTGHLPPPPPPAGWYPSPGHAGFERWWEGSAWTGAERPAAPGQGGGGGADR